MAPPPHHNCASPRIWLAIGLHSNSHWSELRMGHGSWILSPLNTYLSFLERIFVFSLPALPGAEQMAALSSPLTIPLASAMCLCVVSPHSESSADTSWASCNPTPTQANQVVSDYHRWSVWSPEVGPFFDTNHKPWVVLPVTLTDRL